MAENNKLTDVLSLIEHVQFNRESAFYGLPESICGIDCIQLTPLRFSILCESGTAFLDPQKEITKAEVLKALWILSTDFPKGQKKFALRHADINPDEAAAAIGKYLSDAFADRESWVVDQDNQPSHRPGMLAIVADTLGSQYGYTWEQAVNTPFKIYFQLKKIMRMRLEDKPTIIEPWDAQLSEALAQGGANGA